MSHPIFRLGQVAGRGRRVGLDLFYTGHRGWGVRLSPNMPVLKPGQFICTYSGEVSPTVLRNMERLLTEELCNAQMVTSERAEKRGLSVKPLALGLTFC